MPKKHRVNRQKQYDRTRRMDVERRDYVAKQQEKGRLRNRGEAEKRERPDDFNPVNDEENLGFMDDVDVNPKAVEASASLSSKKKARANNKQQSKAAEQQQQSQAVVDEPSQQAAESRNKLKAKFAAKAPAATGVQGDQLRGSIDGSSKLRRVEDD